MFISYISSSKQLMKGKHGLSMEKIFLKVDSAKPHTALNHSSAIVLRGYNMAQTKSLIKSLPIIYPC